MEPFEALDALDIAIDGADQVAPDGWVIKGGGGAHTREKVVAAASARFVVIASSDKVGRRARAAGAARAAELRPAGHAAPAGRGAGAARDAPSPDGGVIADYLGAFDDPRALAERLTGSRASSSTACSRPTIVSDVLIARGAEVEHRHVVAT